MLNVVMILAKALVVEAVVLLMALAVIIFTAIKNIKVKSTDGQGFLKLLKIELSSKLSREQEYVKLYELALLLYWGMILTSIWCFTVLTGFIFMLELPGLVVIMLIEVVSVYTWMRRRVCSDGESIGLVRFVDSKLSHLYENKGVKWFEQKTKYGIFSVKDKIE